MVSSLDKVLNNSASGLSAQSIRMNVIASNLANAGSIGGSEEGTYHKKFPIFSEVKQKISGLNDQDQPIGGVRVSDVKSSKHPLERRYDPNNPSADQNGYIFMTDVNPIEEMTNMISASKEYEANIEVMNTTKGLIAQSLNVIKD